MTTYGAVLVGRNDNYGNYLIERATYSLNTIVHQLDQVIFVDWATDDRKPTLPEEIKDGLTKKDNFYFIKITPDQAKEWTKHDPEAQVVCEVLARNIGLRRLSTDYLISTNPDIIFPYRKYFDGVISKEIFLTAALRSISLYDIRELGTPQEYSKVIDALEIKKETWGQEPNIEVCEGDKFSLISRPGDFQLAHRDIWYKIRGFEESLTGRGFADSNVQRKAYVYGFGLSARRYIPVWHIGHEKGMGGYGRMNDMHKAIFLSYSENLSTWGFSNVDLEMRQL